MAGTFLQGETVICSCTVKNSIGALVDSSTSLKITIINSQKQTIVDNQDMAKDSTGTYHYDYSLSDTAPIGIYLVRYKATDGSRVSMTKDTFSVE